VWERKESSFLSVSASVQKDGRTLLRWWSANGGERLQAVSNVDFRFLAGIGSFETEKCVYSLFMSIGPDAQPLAAEFAALAKWLPKDGRRAQDEAAHDHAAAGGAELHGSDRCDE